MKKILLTVCFAVASFAAFAQIPSIGFKAGVNFAGQSVSGDGSNVTVNSGTLTTFNAGVFVDFKFGNVSLQPALNFTGKGAKYTGDVTDDNGNNIGSTTATERLYYLQVPVNLVYHIPVVVGNVYFGAGPYIAEGISGRVKVPASGGGDAIDQKVTFGSSDGDVSSTQFGVNAIVGFKFKTGFLINANYDLGLTNDVAGSSTGEKIKSHVFGVSVGFAF